MSRYDHIMAWQVPAAYLKVILQQLRNAGHELEPLLADTGLPETTVHDPALISVDFVQTRQLLANATALLGPGWHTDLAQGLSPSSHGPLGFAMVSAPNLQTAIETLIRFIGTRVPFIWLSSRTDQQTFSLRLHEIPGLGAERQLLIEMVMLAIQGLLERPLGHSLEAATIHFAHPRPNYHPRLQKALHPRICYQARHHSLSFPVNWLEQDCLLHDQAMHRYLLARCREELESLTGTLPTEMRVRQALLKNLTQPPSLEKIAAQQHISARTLIRRLKTGNTSYQKILTGIRQTLAIDYLRHTDLNMADIAWRLGYRDPSNFGRAFRGWFKCSPAQYRQQQAIQLPVLEPVVK